MVGGLRPRAYLGPRRSTSGEDVRSIVSVDMDASEASKKQQRISNRQAGDRFGRGPP